MTGLKDQCFGVEVEMTGITRKQAAQALADYFGTISWPPHGWPAAGKSSCYLVSPRNHSSFTSCVTCLSGALSRRISERRHFPSFPQQKKPLAG